MLAAREKGAGSVVIELSPDDYSYEMLSSVMKQEKEGAWAKQGAYAAAWKYLIWVLIMKGLTGQGPKLKTGAASKIYAYLRDNHHGQQSNPIGTMVSYLKRIEGFKVGSFEASMKTRELMRLYRLEEIEVLVPSIAELCKRFRVLVLIDELDRGWDASEDAKAFVSGLFQAAVSINQVSTSLRVMIALRKELYDSIPSLYEDAQKYRDVMETVEWDEPSLLQLVARRIRHSVPQLGIEEGDQECWDQIFAEQLDYRQVKSFNYMIDRTLYRPREIIQFCTDAAEELREEKLGLPIDYGVITRAEFRYSEQRTKDIAAEYRFQNPGLMSIFDVFRGRPYTFTNEELELLCLGISTGEFKLDKEAKWALNQEPDLLIDILWRIGFLRAQAVGGIKATRRSGSSYVGPHQISNLNLRNVPRFHVHPMFRSFLGMKEAREQASPAS